MSVSNILKGFNKLVTKLEKHAVKETKKADKKVEKRAVLSDQIGEHGAEAHAAEAAARNFKALIG